MTFEEQLHKEIDKWNFSTVDKFIMEQKLIMIYNAHCLDKQKVREEFTTNGDLMYQSVEVQNYVKESLKRLGL